MSAESTVHHWLSGAALAAFCTVILSAGCTNGQGIEKSPASTMTQTESATAAIPSLVTTITLTPIPLPSITPISTPEPGVVVVDAAQSLGEINPFIYGTNVGPWQSITKADVDLIKKAGLTIFRFPGGKYVDENAPSQSSLDEFILLCRETGAEPMVQVKLLNSTPETAASMVEYANIIRGYGIKYWSIGNEPSLYWGQRNVPHYDTAAFNAEWREFALAMKTVDPSILLLGPEIHQYTGLPGDAIVDIHYKDWMGEFLRSNGDLVDVVAFHRYPFGNFDPFPDEFLRNSQEWDKIIPNLRQLILSTTGREIPIAVTEVNSNWSNRSREETTPDTLLNAIWWADVLGRMMEQRVSIVNQFAIDGNGGWALLGSQQPRPTYYVYLIFKEFGRQLLFSSSGVSNVSAYAAARPDGALSLVLVNRNKVQTQVDVNIRNFEISGLSRKYLLDVAHLAEELPQMQLRNRSSITLPALSVTLLVIPTSG